MIIIKKKIESNIIRSNELNGTSSILKVLT